MMPVTCQSGVELGFKVCYGYDLLEMGSLKLSICDNRVSCPEIIQFTDFGLSLSSFCLPSHWLLLLVEALSSLTEGRGLQ